ncbi:hypothetical protein PENTCL1PPCAC_7252, partial [Pristionchus entomophagus]
LQMTRLFLVCAALLIATVAARGNRHHGKPPCGLPKFTEKLSGEKKSELETIWKDFKEGEDCDDEREKTKEFVSKLSDEERKSLFGDRHHRGGPHFLRGVPEEVRDKFHTIFRDHTVEREEKHKMFHELAMKELKGDNLEEFLKFEKSMEERKAEWNKKVEALSADAKKVYEQLQALREQKRKILADAKPEIRKELDALFEGAHHHGHHRFGRHGHHQEERRI